MTEVARHCELDFFRPELDFFRHSELDSESQIAGQARNDGNGQVCNDGNAQARNDGSSQVQRPTWWAKAQK